MAILEGTPQLVVAGVVGAAAVGSLYVSVNESRVGRAVAAFFVGAALAVAAVLVLGGGAREGTFAFLGAGVLVAAVAALKAEQLMHSAVLTAFALLGVAGVYLTLGAEFLAAIQTLVYVGAVITLILFTVMLTQPTEEAADLRQLDLPAGVTVEKVEDIQQAVPAFTGVGPWKALKETNPRRVTRIPETMEGVAITDEKVGTAHERPPQPKEDAE